MGSEQEPRYFFSGPSSSAWLAADGSLQFRVDPTLRKWPSGEPVDGHEEPAVEWTQPPGSRAHHSLGLIVDDALGTEGCA